MKKMKMIFLLIVIVSLISSAFSFNTFADSTRTVYCFTQVLNSGAVLNDGDKVMFQNQNVAGTSWLKWYMGGYHSFYPMLTNVTALPTFNTGFNILQ
ncbi:MAG: hypothetical protein N2645_13195 [Clostridia bacterium]|nr:hypothetical protein [Clostridia bacterium]